MLFRILVILQHVVRYSLHKFSKTILC